MAEITIKALEVIGKGWPEKNGKKLAEYLLENAELGVDEITIDLRKVPPKMLISVFFAHFCIRLIMEEKSSYEHFENIKWQVDHDFQQESIGQWLSKYRTDDGKSIICPGVRHIAKPENMSILLAPGDHHSLVVVENGTPRAVCISDEVAEVLIASGFSYGN